MKRTAAVAGAPLGPAEDLPAPLELGPEEPAPTGRGRHRRRPAGSQRERCAVGYLRRSTDRQEQSIPDQRRAVEAYCAQHGLRLVRCYVDDAISGTSTVGRRGFQEMIAHAQQPACEFGIIVAYDVKRFGRVDNDEAGYWRHLLRQHGVEVHYASENFTGDGTDDLLRPVKQWQARQESKDLSKVTIRGLLSKSTTGHWMGGAPPFGYDLRYESQSGQFLFCLRYNADGTKVMFDEGWNPVRTLERGETVAVSRRDHCTLVLGEASRVATVRRIFRLYVRDGLGFKAIADRLNAEGVPTARGPQWAEHYSGQWAMTTVRAILVNPAYGGDMVWNRRTDARFHRIASGAAVERKDVHARRLEPNERADWAIVRDAHPALVSRRVWELAQGTLGGKSASSEQRGLDQRLRLPAGGRRIRRVGDLSGPRARFLLSRLVSCARCGSRYEGYTQRGRALDEHGERERTFYYACGGYIRRGKSVCTLGEVRQELLEEAVVGALLEHYAKYTGADGEILLAEAVRRQLGLDDDEVGATQRRVREELGRVEGTVRRLLDNITPASRAAVGRRLEELERERAQLEERLDALERVGRSRAEVRALVEETGLFIATLGSTLRSGPLEGRQAALRRCVESVELDHAGGSALVRVRVVPVAGGAGEASALTIAATVQ